MWSLVSRLISCNPKGPDVSKRATSQFALLLMIINAAKHTCLPQRLLWRMQDRRSKLLSLCRPQPVIGPVLWLPMTTQEQSRCTRWRIGWLFGGEPKPCPRYPSYMLTRSHVANCLGMHQQLCLPITIPDPLSFLFN